MACAWRCRYIVALGWSFLRLGHSLVVSFIIVGSLSPLWYSLIVSCSGCTRTLLSPLPLLLPKPYSTSQKTTPFLDFPHCLILTPIHLPCIIPSNPHLHDTHNLHTPGLYSSEFIFNIHFSQMRILIDSYKYNKNLPLGPLKNSLSASLQDLTVSTVNLVMYPSKMLLSHTSIALDSLLSTSFSYWNNYRVQQVGLPPWKFVFR